MFYAALRRALPAAACASAVACTLTSSCDQRLRRNVVLAQDIGLRKNTYALSQGDTAIDSIVEKVVDRISESGRQEYVVLCTGKFSTQKMRELLTKLSKQLPACEVYVIPCKYNGEDDAVQLLQTFCPNAVALQFRWVSTMKLVEILGQGGAPRRQLYNMQHGFDEFGVLAVCEEEPAFRTLSIFQRTILAVARAAEKLHHIDGMASRLCDAIHVQAVEGTQFGVYNGQQYLVQPLRECLQELERNAHNLDISSCHFGLVMHELADELDALAESYECAYADAITSLSKISQHLDFTRPFSLGEAMIKQAEVYGNSLVRLDDGMREHHYKSGEHDKIPRAAAKFAESLLICWPGSKVDVNGFACWVAKLTGYETTNLEHALNAYDEGALHMLLAQKFVILVHDLEWDDRQVVEALHTVDNRQIAIVAQVAICSEKGGYNLARAMEETGSMREWLWQFCSFRCDRVGQETRRDYLLFFEDKEAHNQQEVLKRWS